MMKAANLNSPARKAHIDKMTDSDLSEKLHESQDEEVEPIDASNPGASHIVNLGKSLTTKTDQKEKRRQSMVVSG